MGAYLLVRKEILPDYYEKVLQARKLLESGQAKDVSQAARLAGISRSTFYKYRDDIFEPNELSVGRNAVISAMLSHEPGVLNALLSQVADCGGNILSISQSLPVKGAAGVTLSLDIGSAGVSPDELLRALRESPGVQSLKLLAIE